MQIKNKSLVRRKLAYGFQDDKDGNGQVQGDSVVTLARRNAYELVGLRRPVFAPAWRWKVS